MRRAAFFALPSCALVVVGCTQLLSLDDAVIEPDGDASVVLPIPDGVAIDTHEELDTKLNDAAPDTADTAVEEIKPSKDSRPDD